MKMIVEPSAAVPYAAILENKIDVREMRGGNHRQRRETLTLDVVTLDLELERLKRVPSECVCLFNQTR